MENPSYWKTFTEISIIAAIDGENCDSDESALGYYGLILWISLCIYLMVGQFVICEEYFVPILARLGDRWKMAEDVQGATLLAVGSSSPELFTALLGVIFYPDDNPGPGTNVGSAVFNMCIIVGLSAIFAPKAGKLAIIPFLRDSISYMIGLIMMFLFYSVITPHYMDLWESIVLTLWWVIYVFIVYRTDLLAIRCCCCVPQANKEKTIKEIEATSIGPIPIAKQDTGNNYVPLTYEDEKEPDHRPSFVKKKTIVKHGHSGKLGVKYDARGHALEPEEDENPENVIMVPGALGNTQLDDDLQELLDELNRRQRQNVNKGWVVVVMPADQAKTSGFISSHNPNDKPLISMEPELSINQQKPHKHPNAHAYVRRRTLMETLDHQKMALDAKKASLILNGDTDQFDDEQDEEHGHTGNGTAILHRILWPWTKLFHYTLPNPDGKFSTNHIFLTIFLIIGWLGILTFLVVDSSEKIGNCFGMPGDLLGITLLAVGSSLPDCISSIIVARQGKIDMAVANAFGSNIFDVNLCIGISFALGSLVNGGKAIDLGDKDTFSELILAAAGFLVLLWLMIWCTLFRLEKWIGYVLSVTYVGYICVFSVLFIHEQDEAILDSDSDPFGES